MSRISNTWTMRQFRHDFEAVFWAATKGPQLITVRGVPGYVLVPETPAATRRAKVDRMVTLHKLKRGKW